MLGKELNKYCSEFFDKDAIVNSLKINKFLCLIIFAFCVLNLLVCFSDLPDKIFIVDIIKNYTYNPLFYILILVPLLIINLNYSLFNKINNSNYGDSSNLKNSNKFKKLNKLNIIFTGLAVIYLILAILSSFSNTIILSGWTDVFPDSKLFLLIFILYVVGLICLVFKRFITLAHILGILTFILGFTGFLYYSPAASNLLSLSLNYLIFIVGISYLLLTTYPEEGITKIFILVSSGSKSAKKVVYLVAIFSALICLVIVYINDVTSVFLEEGALTSGFFMTLIIILMIYYSYKVSLADIYIKLANRRTYENKIFFEDLIKNMDDGVIVTNKDLNIIYANKCVLEYLNEDLSIVGKNIFKSSIPFLEDSIDEISKSINNSESVFIESKEGHNIDGSNYFKNNNDSNKKCSPFLTGWCSPRIKKGNFEGCIFTLIDITSEKQKESILKHSIKEKNIILAEVHHRVKNNMQIISSLLNLQSYNIDDKELLKKVKIV